MSSNMNRTVAREAPATSHTRREENRRAYELAMVGDVNRRADEPATQNGAPA
jgi:hypothetical protein